MSAVDNIVAILLIIILIFIIYTRAKNQTLKDTFQEVKEIFITKEVE